MSARRGWRIVRLDNGERIQIMMLNPPYDDLPKEIEWPVGSGQKRQIVTVEKEPT